MSYSPINSLRKAVKDEKVTKMTKRSPTSWILSPLPFRNSRGKPSMKLTSRRLWLSPADLQAEKVLFFITG
jgi:hypothetical protein